MFNFTLEHDIKIDILINNAGFGDSGSFADSDRQKQYEMVQLNVVALMQLTHCFLNSMIEQGHGRILNMSSVAAFCAGPYMSIYYATKEFVRSFSEAVAEEVKGTGVTVTAFCPGPTATGFEQAAAMDKGSAMFRKAAKAEDVAKGGIRAMMRGWVLSYHGAYTKCMSGQDDRVKRRGLEEVSAYIIIKRGIPAEYFSRDFPWKKISLQKIDVTIDITTSLR